ncbi:caspase family protein [Oricola sp.]|uniref:caspase family protein n=1 Tax=Oricola sp. TaxID=1979950 RepID=UPI0025E7DD85|nr:caspase family protein [Oricola sp.]MCI5078649.1 caspase family protein [Oricola sp.]
MLRTILVLFVLMTASAASAYAATDKRVALVVGVSSYEHATTLSNPKNDAEAVSDALEKLGFTVLLELDVDQASFGKALLEFERELEGADVGLFYFAGHGMQIADQNYLLSANATVSNPYLIDQDGIRLNSILGIIERKADVSIAIIDACRDNPLVDALLDGSRDAGRSFGLARGLARVTPGRNDSLVAFATAPGQIALDGSEPNSPFTQALLEHLDEPGLEVSVMLKRVTNDVMGATGGKQRPEIVASMTREFYFVKQEINVEGDLHVTTERSDEAAAAELMAVARTMPAGEARIAALELVRGRFPDTGVAEMAAILIGAERAALAAAEAAKEPSGDEPAPQTAATDGQDKVASMPEAAVEEEDITVETFDRELLSSLDVEQALAASSNAEVQAAATPEQVEAGLGLEKEEVVRIQTALNTLGYGLGTADGAFGPKSRKALALFQLRNRIPQSGYLDAKTIDALLSVLESAPKTYDGEWRMTISRRWLVNDTHSSDTIGTVNLIASVLLEHRNGQFYVKDYHYYTIVPDDPFSDFAGGITNDGVLQVSGRVSSHFADANHVTANLVRLSAKLQLPRIALPRTSFETDGTRIDGSLRFVVSFARVAS